MFASQHCCNVQKTKKGKGMSMLAPCSTHLPSIAGHSPVWRGVYTAIIDMLVFILCFLHVAAILRCKENVVGHRVAVLCNFNVN